MRTTIAVLFLGIILPACLFSGPIEDKCSEAEKLIETRHIDIKNVDKARDILSDVLKESPENAKANMLMSRIVLFTGERMEKNDTALKVFEQGISYGEKAMKAAPDSADARFFYAANLGKTAELRGIFNALGIAGQVRDEFLKILKDHPDHLLTLNAISVYYRELPGLLGGSIEKSEEYLNKAKTVDPNYSMTFVNLGIVYKNTGRRDKAKESLQYVLKMDNPTNKAYYALGDKPDAEKLLKELN